MVKQHRSIIKFCNFRLFPMTVYLNLLWIDFGSTSKPCFCYP